MLGGVLMTKTKLYCDRCKKEIEEDALKIIFKKWRMRLWSSSSYGKPIKEYDLCRDCENSFHIFMKGGQR